MRLKRTARLDKDAARRLSAAIWGAQDTGITDALERAGASLARSSDWIEQREGNRG
jgi:hypothetical protein